MENLNKILPENTIPAQSKFWKSFVLAIFSFIFQTLTWYTLRLSLDDPSAAKWIAVAITAAVAISITTFFLLTKKTKWLSDVLVVASAASYFLISPRNIYVWIGGLIFALLALWYENRIRHEAVSRVDFSVTRVIGGSASILIYAILLLLGFNIYYEAQEDFRNNPDKYYNRIGQQAAKTVPYFTQALPDNVNVNEPLGKYLEQVAQNNPEYQNASSFQREVIFQQAKLAFQNQFQITASEDQTLAQIMAQVAVGKIREVVDPFKNYIPLIFTIVIIGVLYTFAFLIRAIIIIFSWILFQILRGAKFFKLEKVQVEVEKLEI